MIEISKNSEPHSLTQFKLLPGASYETLDHSVKEDLYERLLNEQGHLCAYCMSRIPQAGKTPSVSIEHWKAQSNSSSEDALDYGNMLAVCSGNRGGGDFSRLTCDAHRENTSLIVNPLNPETLQSISYHSDGTIFSTNVSIENDINVTLNLNSKFSFLPENRKAALESMKRTIAKKSPSNFRNYCKKLLCFYSRDQAYKEPYVGILIDWLKKHVS